MQVVFKITNLNDTGVCLSLVCEWIKSARAGNPICNESGFRSRLATFLNHHVSDVDTTWRLSMPNNSLHIITNVYHLPVNDSIVQSGGLDLNALDSWLDDNCFWGFIVIGLTSKGAGHSVAIWYGPTSFMYFDPNVGCFEFNNAIEMLEWIKNDLYGPIKKYPLFNRPAHIIMVPRLSVLSH